MLRRDNYWIMILGSAFMFLTVWFGSYWTGHEPELPISTGPISNFATGNANSTWTAQTLFGGKISAVVYASAKCEDNCKKSVSQMAKLAKIFKNDPKFQLVAVSDQSESQRVELQSSLIAADGSMLSAELVILGPVMGRRMVVDELGIATYSGETATSDRLAIVDDQGKVRGSYSIDDSNEMIKFQNAIYNLLRKMQASLEQGSKTNRKS
jgi:hypothetical protein